MPSSIRGGKRIAEFFMPSPVILLVLYERIREIWLTSERECSGETVNEVCPARTRHAY